MKKWILFISALLFTGLIVTSCASKSGNQTVSKTQQKKEIPVVEIEEPEPSPEEIFLDSLKDIKIQFTNIPDKTKKGKAFTSPYEIYVTKEEAPLAGFNFTLEIPQGKEDSTIVFDKIDMTTDENGLALYNPEIPAFAAQTKVSAAPTIPQGLNIQASQIEPYRANADFLCESDIVSKGAIMFVFEYNENGRSPKNSYDILSGLRKKGVYQIGNAPLSDTEYINASKEKIYKENYAYVGSDFGYLIGGTIKFTNPVEQNEDGTYTASMVADMYGIEMKTGKVIYEDQITYKDSGTNWNYAVSNCRNKLTQLVVDSIMFGL